MATTAEAIELIARDTGMPEAAVLRYARALRDESKGLWPIGGKGGGKNAAHVQAHHLVNMILALVAPQPSDGPEMVRRLRELRHTKREWSRKNSGGDPDKPGAKFAIFGTVEQGEALFTENDLGKLLEVIITDIATWRQAERATGETPEVLSFVRGARWSLSAIPDFSMAWSRYTHQDGSVSTDQYRHPQGDLGAILSAAAIPPAAIQRSVTINFALMESAAAILSGTAVPAADDIHGLTMDDLLTLAGQGATSTPETGTPSPGKGTAPDTNQPTNGPTGPLCTPDPNGERDSAQHSRAASLARSAGTPPKRKGSSHVRDNDPPPPSAARAA
jgi:hypothetical protein